MGVELADAGRHLQGARVRVPQRRRPRLQGDFGRHGRRAHRRAADRPGAALPRRRRRVAQGGDPGRERQHQRRAPRLRRVHAGLHPHEGARRQRGGQVLRPGGRPLRRRALDILRGPLLHRSHQDQHGRHPRRLAARRGARRRRGRRQAPAHGQRPQGSRLALVGLRPRGRGAGALGARDEAVVRGVQPQRLGQLPLRPAPRLHGARRLRRARGVHLRRRQGGQRQAPRRHRGRQPQLGARPAQQRRLGRLQLLRAQVSQGGGAQGEARRLPPPLHQVVPREAPALRLRRPRVRV